MIDHYEKIVSYKGFRIKVTKNYRDIHLIGMPEYNKIKYSAWIFNPNGVELPFESKQSTPEKMLAVAKRFIDKKGKQYKGEKISSFFPSPKQFTNLFLVYDYQKNIKKHFYDETVSYLKILKKYLKLSPRSTVKLSIREFRQNFGVGERFCVTRIYQDYTQYQKCFSIAKHNKKVYYTLYSEGA